MNNMNGRKGNGDMELAEDRRRRQKGDMMLTGEFRVLEGNEYKTFTSMGDLVTAYLNNELPNTWEFEIEKNIGYIEDKWTQEFESDDMKTLMMIVRSRFENQ